MEKKFDEINNPKHYENRTYSVLEMSEDLGFQYCLYMGNVWKYVLRCMQKGQTLSDLKKAVFYIDRKIKRIEKGELSKISSIDEFDFNNKYNFEIVCKDCCFEEEFYSINLENAIKLMIDFGLNHDKFNETLKVETLKMIKISIKKYIKYKERKQNEQI